jgi:multidrug efflux pump subunit AcrA (membrane-fusion protein)
MPASRSRPLLLITLFIWVAACGQETPKPAATPALSRPLVTPQVRNGRVLVPQTAVTNLGGTPGVYVMTPDQTARFRMVRTGKSYDGRVEVLSGLAGNEVLVTGDVHDGSPIQPR